MGHQGKLVVIVDVVNHNEALVYGPTSGVARQLLSYKRMQLTDIVLDISRGQRKKNVDAAWAKAEVEGQFNKTGWCKKLAARKAKAAMGDFDRFKAMVARRRSTPRPARP